MAINNRRELWISRACILLTLTALSGLFHFLYQRAHMFYAGHDLRGLAETALFATVMFFMGYGNLLYQICLMGYHKRKSKYRQATRGSLESLYAGNAPSLSILIPAPCLRSEFLRVRQDSVKFYETNIQEFSKRTQFFLTFG